MSASPYFAPARPMSRNDAKTLALASLGGALEFYDFIIFVFFAPVIGFLFFPADTPDWLKLLQSYGIFAAGYLIRPLGGVVLAHFGDMIGRKRMFTLSVFLMAAPTLIIGLLPTYETLGYGAPILLLAMRLVQGAAIGGEVPGAWVFVAEHVPKNKVGFACGLLCAGLTVGILLGTLVAGWVNSNLSEADVHLYGWRMAFILGGLFGLVVVYLRRYLEETPVFKEISRMKMLSASLPLKEVIANHFPSVLLSIAVTWVLTAGIVVVTLLSPSLLSKIHGLPMALTLAGDNAATILLAISCVLTGCLCDRFGPAKIMVIWTIGLTASIFSLYLFAGTHPEKLVFLYGITGFFVGVVAAVPVIMVRAFPPAVRFTGISLSFNVAYAIFGGLTPLILPVVTMHYHLAPAIYVTLAAVTATGLALRFAHLYKMR